MVSILLHTLAFQELFVKARAFETSSFLANRRPVVLIHSSATLQGTARSAASQFPEPSSDRTFGRKQYWEDAYRDAGDDAFSWYSGWDDLAPFVREQIPDQSSRILIPGIGNDAMIVDMYDAGYETMTAFDYAPQGVTCAKRLLGSNRHVELLVADARKLPFPNACFDAALDKGTLDAVYLSGGLDKELSKKHLEMAVSELARVLRPGGVVMSLSAACADAVESMFNAKPNIWNQLRDGNIYITKDGFASNNVDGSLFSWERRSDEHHLQE